METPIVDGGRIRRVMGRQMEVHFVTLDRLQHHAENVRAHGARSVDGVRASLDAFGQQKPIVALPPVDGEPAVVIAGNGTLAAARMEPALTGLWVVYTDLPPETATAYAIADNRTSDLSGWDYAALVSTLSAIEEPLRRATGWSDDELAAMRDAMGAALGKPLDPDLASLGAGSGDEPFTPTERAISVSVTFSDQTIMGAVFEAVSAAVERWRDAVEVKRSWV